MKVVSKSRILVVLLSISIFLTVSACSRSYEAVTSDKKADSGKSEDMDWEGYTRSGEDKATSKINNNTGTGKSEGEPTATKIKKVIRNGEIAVEVKDVDTAYTHVSDIVNELGGEEFSKNYNISGKYKRLQLVLKIPPEKLDEFQEKLIHYVGSNRIKRISLDSNDITSQYYDVAARLESYEASRDQLRDLLKIATTVEDTLKIHNELTRLQADIDAYRGQIKVWDHLVSLATITLYIDEDSDPMRHTKNVEWKFNSGSDIWNNMRNGFITTINAIYSIIIWLVIAFVSFTPVIIPVAVVIFIILWIDRKGKQK